MTSKQYNIADQVDVMAEKCPEQIAIYFPKRQVSDDDFEYQSLTFSQLKKEIHIMAKGLLGYGLQKGDRVALMVTPSMDFFILTFALFKANLVPILIDPGIGLNNLKTCLAEAAPRGFIGVAKAQLARLVFGWSRKTLEKIIHVGAVFLPGTNLNKIKKLGLQSDIKLPTTNPEDTAAIIFTSGSTGISKGVVYTHQNFSFQIELVKTIYQPNFGGVDLPTFPLFALFNPALGMTSVIPFMDFTKPAGIHPPYLLKAIDRFQVTHMFGSPGLVNTLSRYCEEKKITCQSLKRVLSAGAPVQPQIAARVRKLLNESAILLTPYGATEALPVSSVEGELILSEGKIGNEQGAGTCVGFPVKGIEVKIIKITDDIIQTWSDDLLVESGTKGEIVVKGAQVTAQYYNRDQATRLAKIADGETFWHRMGDIGYFDQQGRLWFCGRKSHRVVIGNTTYFTVPCEGVFNWHPAVFRSALVKVHDQPVICLELEKGYRLNDIISDLQARALQFNHTKNIKTFLVHPSFPVDIRHNAKIFREKLALWAIDQIK